MVQNLEIQKFKIFKDQKMLKNYVTFHLANYPFEKRNYLPFIRANSRAH